jgi:hypothetical protein
MVVLRNPTKARGGLCPQTAVALAKQRRKKRRSLLLGPGETGFI